jgi:hypothetical protein
MNALGATVYGTMWLDSTAISTFTVTGSARQSYVFSLPAESYGRTGWVEYNALAAGTRFKHYQTWCDKRQEPDRVASYVTPRKSGEEHWWHTLECDLDCLGGTVLATTILDGVAIQTATLNASNRQSFALALPPGKYGRTIYTVYNATANGRFKHYNTWWDGQEEPDRVTSVESQPWVMPANHSLRTWIAELNPLGTCTAILSADGTAISTQTFVGTDRQAFVTGLELDASQHVQEASRLTVLYFSPTAFKHYATNFEAEPNAFGKKTWAIFYKKVGGASQLDIGRFWEISLHQASTNTSTVTYAWDVDESVVSTGTLTFTGHQFQDRIAFPPGVRGYEYRLRLSGSVPFRVEGAGLDTLQIGVKGLVRRMFKGTPNNQT